MLEGIYLDIDEKLPSHFFLEEGFFLYDDLVKYFDEVNWLGGSKELMLEILDKNKQLVS